MTAEVIEQQWSADRFADLYAGYRPMVHAYIARRIPDSHAAEDLTHDVFVRALRNIDGWRWQGKDVGAWLNTIAANMVTDWFKNIRRRTYPSAFDGESDVFLSMIASDDPAGDALDRIRDQALLAAVVALPPDQRECVTNRFMRGLSVAETATAMARSEEAVKSLQFRAARNLRGRVAA